LGRTDLPRRSAGIAKKRARGEFTTKGTKSTKGRWRKFEVLPGKEARPNFRHGVGEEEEEQRAERERIRSDEADYRWSD